MALKVFKQGAPRKNQGGALRQRILTFVGALIVLSLLGSTMSLYRITEVNRLLDAINRVSVPLGRLFTQLQSDSELLRREFDRGMGHTHWKDPHWRPRPIPQWLTDVLENELTRATQLVQSDLDWAAPEARARWREWFEGIFRDLKALRSESTKLYTALDQKDEAAISRIFPALSAGIEDWRSRLQWGASDYERSSRQTFALAESRVSELRTGLEMILIVVISLSLTLLWLGERALRPLGELTRLAREITRRGLRKEDKSLLPEISLLRTDEVSQLAREFHNMATALLEREKMVEAQKSRLQDQNRLLKDMVDLQERLRVAENLAAIGRMSAQVAHEVRNPLHSIGLEAEMAIELANQTANSGLKQALQSILGGVDRLQKITENYLKLSKLSSGSRGEVDLREVLESTLATYAPVCEVQGVQVEWKVEAHSCLKVLGDRDLLEQVLGNLLKNALQAVEESRGEIPRVCWTLGHTESGKVWIKIEDNGPGVSAEIREKLFTPFVTTRAQGTGLGLSFIKRVVEDHGGEIEYRKKKEGGACFLLSLPFAESPGFEKTPSSLNPAITPVLEEVRNGF